MSWFDFHHTVASFHRSENSVTGPRFLMLLCCEPVADKHDGGMTLLSVRVQFGDSQQLRLVRILRSTVMVRVGGGWMALDEFLVKNDPCRGNVHPLLLHFMFNHIVTVQLICKQF